MTKCEGEVWGWGVVGGSRIQISLMLFPKVRCLLLLDEKLNYLQSHQKYLMQFGSLHGQKRQANFQRSMLFKWRHTP